MWNRPHVPTLQSQDLPWTPSAEHHVGGGALHKVLSTDPADGAETSLVQIVTPRSGASDAAMDLFVLEGVGTLNGGQAAPNGYCFVEAGDRFDLLPEPPGMVVLVMSFGAPTLSPAASADGAGPTMTDVHSMPWADPEWGGGAPITPGTQIKWLRDDDRGILYYSAKLPGWYHTVDEWHPHHEESFRVFGDNLLGEVVSGPGSYFFRPPQIWHGPLYTRSGTASYIRADVKTVTRTRPMPPGSDVDTLRRAAFDHLGHPALRPWSVR